MPISFAEHQQPNQILVIVSGETSMQDMMSFIVTTRTGGLRHCAFLFDISAATVGVSEDEVMQLAAYAADEAGKAPMGPVAFISSEPGAFGLSRMYQAYSAAAGRNNVGVFRTLSDAQAWLANMKRN